MNYSLTIAISLVLCAAATACGSHGDDSSATDSDAGTSGAGGGSGTGGSGASGSGAGGGGGTGGTMAAVTCGSQTCTVQGIAATFGAQACCVDASTNMCGTSMGGGACTPPAPPGMPDDRCTPPMSGGGLSIPLKGCCINDMCGVDVGAILGGTAMCYEYSQLSTLGGGMAAALLGDLKPRRCDAPVADAGMMDTDAGM